MTTYERGQAVEFNGAPALILDASRPGQLHIATFAGMSSYIGPEHSKLAPAGDWSPVFVERANETRAYYGLPVDLSESNRTMVNLLVEFARARKTTSREALFARGSELASIDSLMLANVAMAVTIASAEVRGAANR